MTRALLLDTHAWVWALLDSPSLSGAAREALRAAAAVYVSPISVFEIGQKARLGKWPEMAPHLDRLPGLITARGARQARFDAEVALAAATLEWTHRDPFDRLLAATALVDGLTLVTKDPAFSTLPPERRPTTLF